MKLKSEDSGQLLFVGFDGPAIDGRARSLLLKMRPGGIILFKRNIASAEQLLELCHQLHNLYNPPPLIGIDQEGGRVNRLAFILPDIPDAHTLGQYGDDMIVERLGMLIGKALRALGFDIDFAPVLDLSPPDASNGIGSRSFSMDPELSITMGAAFLRGLLSEGVAGTLKHFPGLGASEIDSHDSLPIIHKKKMSLSAEDIRPFAVLSEIAPLIMIGHGYYPTLCTERIPATLSTEIVSDILRKDISFEGVIITDDMEMGAMKSYASEGDEAVRALQAGSDMVMYASALAMAERAYEKIASSLEKGILEERQLASSHDRIAELKRNFVVSESALNMGELLREVSDEMKEIIAQVKPAR